MFSPLESREVCKLGRSVHIGDWACEVKDAFLGGILNSIGISLVGNGTEGHSKHSKHQMQKYGNTVLLSDFFVL